MTQLNTSSNIQLKRITELDTVAVAEASALLLLYQEGANKKITHAALLQGLARSADVAAAYLSLAGFQVVSGEKSFTSTLNLLNDVMALDINTPTGTAGKIAFETENGDRWRLTSDDADKTFKLQRYSLAGAFVDNPISVSTETGIVSVNNLQATRLKNNNDVIFNVKDYGALGNDTANDLPAINAAIAACPVGGVVYFPAGRYRVLSRVVINKQITLKGCHTPWWEYRPASGVSPCQIKPHADFADTCIVHIPDKEIYGGSVDNDGIRIENIAINGNSKNVGVTGLLIEGLVRDLFLRYVDVSQTSGDAIQAKKYTRADTSVVNPRGYNFSYVSSYNAGMVNTVTYAAFRLDTATDCSFDHCLAVGTDGDGFVLNNPGETKLMGCRAVFNKSRGFVITGTTEVGGLQMIGCSTDRNYYAGLEVQATGFQQIQVVGFLMRRDGAIIAGNTPGIKLVGAPGALICPVQISELSQTIGFNDPGGSGPTDFSPLVGIEAAHCRHLTISGNAWGVDASMTVGTGIERLNLANLLGRRTTAGTIDREQFNHHHAGIFRGESRAIEITTPSGVAGRVAFETLGDDRWQIMKSADPESTGNAGSNLVVNRYNDLGNYIDSPIIVSRATGTTSFNGDVISTGSLISNGDFTTNSTAQFKGATKALAIDTPSGTAGRISLDTDDSPRWQILKSSGAESGANVGSDLSVNRYSDAGAYIDTPITVSRNSGTTTFGRDVVFGQKIIPNGEVEANGTVRAKNTTKAAAIDTPDATDGRLSFDSAGVQRWQMIRKATSNDLTIQRYNSSGAFQDTPITVFSSTGAVTVAKDATFNGTQVTVNAELKAFGGCQIRDAAVPANPVTGNVFYSEIGELKFKNSAGVVSNLTALVAAAAQAYPVGSIYLNASVSTNPASLLGYGTWTQISQGRMLIGVDSGDADFDTAGETGGSKTKTIAQANLPDVDISFTRGQNGSFGTGSTSAFLYDNSSTTSTENDVLAVDGGNTPINIMPPYLAVYIWRRDA